MPTTFRVQPEAIPGDLVHHLVAPPSVGAAPVPTVGSSADSSTPDWWIVAVGFAAVGVAWLVAATLISDSNFPSSTEGGSAVPVAGLTIFAVFFVTAQAIERMLEPIAAWLDPQAEDQLEEAAATAKTAVHSAAKEVDLTGSRGPASAAAQAALNEAAAKKAAAARLKVNRKIIFWATASVVAIMAASCLKLYFLRAVGIATPPRYLDILATGLIIGAGTKPLHDLVTLISSKADSAK